MKLRDYQQTGVAWLQARAAHGCILADDMGLGKTAQAITALAAADSRLLVVCPAYIRSVWVRELQKWQPAATVYELRGVKVDAATAALAAAASVVLVSYEGLRAWVDNLAAHRTAVVFDECHALQSDRSRRSKAARKVAAACKQRVGLSGTPMTNRPRDLWNILDTLSPGRWGGFFQYARRYCSPSQDTIRFGNGDIKVVWNFDGASRLDELRDRLLKTGTMLRRTKEEVAAWLPPKTRQVIELEVPEQYRPRQSALRRDSRQVAAALAAAADGKLEDAVEVVADHLRAGQKVVVFSRRRQVAENIAAELAAMKLEAHVAHGGIAHREDAVAAAAAAAGPAALCCTIDSCGSGIDLSFATVAVFVELTYEPHELLQAESRLHRSGQQQPVLVQYLVAKQSLDEIVVDVVVSKLESFATAIGASAADAALAANLRSPTGLDPLDEIVSAARSRQ